MGFWIGPSSEADSAPIVEAFWHCSPSGIRSTRLGLRLFKATGCTACTDSGCLYVGGWRMGGPVYIFTGISNCRGIPCAAQSLGSAVNWRMGRRGSLGPESQIHRESNHGETGKGGPLWGLNAESVKWPNHGSFEAISWRF